MSTKFEDLRLDFAEVAATAMGIPVASEWSGNLDADTAQVRWGGNGSPWLNRDEMATFGKASATLAVLVVTNADNLEGAQAFLESKVSALFAYLEEARTLTRTGGYCPPAHTASEPSRLQDMPGLFGSLVTLYPIEHEVGTT